MDYFLRRVTHHSLYNNCIPAKEICEGPHLASSEPGNLMPGFSQSKYHEMDMVNWFAK